MSTEITSEYLYQIVKDITAFGPRVPGSKAEYDAAEYIKNSLIESGLSNVVHETNSVRCFKPKSLNLTVSSDGTDYEIKCFPRWYNPSGDVTAEIVDIGVGGSDDWKDKVKGKIVFVTGKVFGNVGSSHKWLKVYSAAEEAGAAGFVAWMDLPCGIVQRYNEIREFDPVGKIPAVLIGREDGLLIKSLIQDGKDVTGHLVTDVEFFEGQSSDISGIIPGSEDIMVIATHFDSVYDGAVDNAAATAVLLGLAKEMAKIEGPHPTVLFAAHGGHENDIGARKYVPKHAEMLKKAYVLLFLDGVAASGFCWSEKGILPMGTNEYRHWHISDNTCLLDMALDISRKHNLYPCTYMPHSTWIPNPDLEAQYYELKIPCIQVVGKPIWFHSVLDTPDKIKPSLLKQSYDAHIDMATRILNESPKHILECDRQPAEEVLARVMPKEIKDAVVGQDDKGIFFDFAPQPSRVGEKMMFYLNTCVNNDAMNLLFTFDFGDGHTANDIFAVHTYEKPGKYTVSLTAIDEKGYRFGSSRELWVK